MLITLIKKITDDKKIMTVTNVEIQKNNKNRVSIFADGEYAFSLDGTDALRMGIKKGRVLSEEDVRVCLEECEYSKAREKAFDIISRKLVSSKELALALSKKGYDDVIIQRVTHEMESLGYIDDAYYAEMFLESCMAKTWGRRKIVYELKQKGISAEIISELDDKLREMYDDDEIKDIIISRYGSEDLLDIKVKARITRYFASRGFDFSDINTAICRAKEELSDE